MKRENKVHRKGSLFSDTLTFIGKALPWQLKITAIQKCILLTSGMLFSPYFRKKMIINERKGQCTVRWAHVFQPMNIYKCDSYVPVISLQWLGLGWLVGFAGWFGFGGYTPISYLMDQNVLLRLLITLSLDSYPVSWFEGDSTPKSRRQWPLWMTRQMTQLRDQGHLNDNLSVLDVQLWLIFQLSLFLGFIINRKRLSKSSLWIEKIKWNYTPKV